MSDTKLSLYSSPLCGYCWQVKRTINKLGVDVEIRDLWKDRTHLEDLVQARGRGTVPVLRIDTDDHSEWLPESSDIIRYLEKHYA